MKVRPDSVVYTDCHSAYNVLDVSEFNHLRINHRTCFADRQNHINGIENFWSQAKRHLRKFNGIPKKHFELYLKECEWRFNNNEMKSQIAMLKQMVKDSLTWLSRTALIIFSGGKTFIVLPPEFFEIIDLGKVEL